MLFVALYGTLAVSMGFLLGQAGVFSFAHPAWFGLGAYVAGITVVRGIAPPWLSIVLSAVLVGLTAWAIGTFLLRLRTHYLACATFSLVFIVEILLGQWVWLTGGDEGLLSIPTLLDVKNMSADTSYYLLASALCLTCLWFLGNLSDSRPGRAIRSLRNSGVAASSLGIDGDAYRLQAFILTAVIAGLAGSLLCFSLRFIMPGMFGFSLLVEIMTMVVIGGPRKIWGPLLGSCTLIWLKEGVYSRFEAILPAQTAQIDPILDGLIIIALLIFLPEGLAGVPGFFVRRWNSARRTA